MIVEYLSNKWQVEIHRIRQMKAKNLAVDILSSMERIWQLNLVILNENVWTHTGTLKLGLREKKEKDRLIDQAYAWL